MKLSKKGKIFEIAPGNDRAIIGFPLALYQQKHSNTTRSCDHRLSPGYPLKKIHSWREFEFIGLHFDSP